MTQQWTPWLADLSNIYVNGGGESIVYVEAPTEYDGTTAEDVASLIVDCVNAVKGNPQDTVCLPRADFDALVQAVQDATVVLLRVPYARLDVFAKQVLDESRDALARIQAFRGEGV